MDTAGFTDVEACLPKDFGVTPYLLACRSLGAAFNAHTVYRIVSLLLLEYELSRDSTDHQEDTKRTDELRNVELEVPKLLRRAAPESSSQGGNRHNQGVGQNPTDGSHSSSRDRSRSPAAVCSSGRERTRSRESSIGLQSGYGSMDRSGPSDPGASSSSVSSMQARSDADRGDGNIDIVAEDMERFRNSLVPTETCHFREKKCKSPPISLCVLFPCPLPSRNSCAKVNHEHPSS